MLLVFCCPCKYSTLSPFIVAFISMQDLCRLDLKQISKMTGSTTQLVSECWSSAQESSTLTMHLLCRYLQIGIWTHLAAEELLLQEAASEHHMLLCTGSMCSHCPLVNLGIKLIFVVCLQARAGADVCKHLPPSCPGKQAFTEEGGQRMYINDTDTVPVFLFLLLKLFCSSTSTYSAGFGSVGEMTWTTVRAHQKTS